MSEFVNKNLYFKSRMLGRQIRNSIKSMTFSKGTCDCGKSGVDLCVVETKQPLRLVFHNGKEKESNRFALGSECVNLLECLK